MEEPELASSFDSSDGHSSAGEEWSLKMLHFHQQISSVLSSVDRKKVNVILQGATKKKL